MPRVLSQANFGRFHFPCPFGFPPKHELISLLGGCYLLPPAAIVLPRTGSADSQAPAACVSSPSLSLPPRLCWRVSQSLRRAHWLSSTPTVAGCVLSDVTMPRTMFGHQRHYHLLPIYALGPLVVVLKRPLLALRGWYFVAVKWSLLLRWCAGSIPWN